MKQRELRRPPGNILARPTDDFIMAMDYYLNSRGQYGYAKRLIERWDRSDTRGNVRVICNRREGRCRYRLRWMSREKWRGLSRQFSPALKSRADLP